MSVASFADWLSTTGASLFIQTHLWVVPAVQSVHILAIGALFASAVLMHSRLGGLAGRAVPLPRHVLRYLPVMKGALAVLVASGLILVAGEPVRELGTGLFWIKMLLILLAAALTFLIARAVPGGTFPSAPPARRMGLRAANFGALCIWCAIIVAGRWIAYAL